jgi:hypothetical protein
MDGIKSPSQLNITPNNLPHLPQLWDGHKGDCRERWGSDEHPFFCGINGARVRTSVGPAMHTDEGNLIQTEPRTNDANKSARFEFDCSVTQQRNDPRNLASARIRERMVGLLTSGRRGVGSKRGGIATPRSSRPGPAKQRAREEEGRGQREGEALRRRARQANGSSGP